MGPAGVPCLILQRLSPWSLGRMLGVARPSDGEAVTILAPLCLAVAELHRVGVAHGRLLAGSVLFDEAGAPVLASFGDAELFGEMPSGAEEVSLAPALLTQQPAVAADLDALAALCLTVLHPASEIAQWLSSPRERDHTWFATELANRLFQSARAAPVNFASPKQEHPTALSSSRVAFHVRRVGAELANASPSGEQVRSEASAPPSFITTVGAFLHLPEGMVDSLHESAHRILDRGPISTFLQRIKEVLGPVRKPVWIMGAAVAIAVVVATAILPSGVGGGAAQPGQPTPSSAPATATRPVPAAILGDDPLAAAIALLDARADCFTALSVLCLDSVDQRGSTAMDSDSAHVRLLQDGGAADGSLVLHSARGDGAIVSPQVSVVERLGDSVLLAVRVDPRSADPRSVESSSGVGSRSVESSTAEPSAVDAVDAQAASFTLLIIKGDAGWRIRDLVPLGDQPY